jgi:TetR/AcrR family transcriptional regulator, regulator of cefoperazone and chloramphenicol sensitivity
VAVEGFHSSGDLTARARIRDAAFELIATAGVRGATLRAIAAQAGVSAPLVAHHFGSKQGVVEAVEEWVQEQLRAVTADDGDLSDPAAANSRRAEAFAGLLSGRPLLREYIRRMVLERSDEGLDLFARMVSDGAANLGRRAEAGSARPVGDTEAVAAAITLMALMPVLLPDHLRHALGDDALTRWQDAVSELMHAPLYPEGQPAGPPGISRRLNT